MSIRKSKRLKTFDFHRMTRVKISDIKFMYRVDYNLMHALLNRHP